MIGTALYGGGSASHSVYSIERSTKTANYFFQIKPECPLCKQTFKSIIHNVTSMDSYDEYKVDQQHRHVSWLNIPSSLQPLDIILSASLPSYR